MLAWLSGPGQMAPAARCRKPRPTQFGCHFRLLAVASIDNLRGIPSRSQLTARRKRERTQERRRARLSNVSLPLKLDPKSPEFDAQVTLAICSADGPRFLAAVLYEYGQHLTSFQQSLLLAALSKFATQWQLSADQLNAYREVGMASLDIIRPQLHLFAPEDLARACEAMGRLGLLDQELTDKVCGMLQPQLRRLPGSALAALGTGVAAATTPPPPAFVPAFADAVTGALPGLTALELAAAIITLAAMGYRPSQSEGAALMGRLREHFGPRLTVTALARCMVALAEMGAVPSFNWSSAVLAEVRAKLDAGRPRELAAMMWSLARLGVAVDSVTLDLWCKAAKHRLADFTATDATTALAALAAMRPEQLTGGFLPALLPRILQLLRSCTPDQAVSLACSLVDLRVKPDRPWMKAYLAAAVQLLSAMGPGQLSDLLWALAKLQQEPGVGLREQLAGRTDELLQAFGSAELVQALWSMQQLGLQPHESWRGELKARVQAEGLDATQLLSPPTAHATEA